MISTTEEANGKTGNKTDLTDEKVTIQTTEGQYEATLRVDNTNNCPIQEN